MRQLDVRTIPPPRRHPEIFQTFDELPIGGSFVLVNDHYPKPLLFQFMGQRAGQFEWNVLEAGPELFRVQIQKRDAAGSRAVSEYLEREHRRLDELMARVVDGLDTGEIDAARSNFDEFACGLERHMQAEEQVLFPAFEQATQMVGGPVAVMHREHTMLRGLLENVSTALAQQDSDTARDELRAAAELLEEHNIKEENVIYPRTDAALAGDVARDELVRQMQGI